MSGNTGVAGGTRGADPVPQKTAPDDSTVLDPDSPLVTTDPPEPDGGEQNTDFDEPNETGVVDDSGAQG